MKRQKPPAPKAPPRHVPRSTWHVSYPTVIDGESLRYCVVAGDSFYEASRRVATVVKVEPCQVKMVLQCDGKCPSCVACLASHKETA